MIYYTLKCLDVILDQSRHESAHQMDFHFQFVAHRLHGTLTKWFQLILFSMHKKYDFCTTIDTFQNNWYVTLWLKVNCCVKGLLSFSYEWGYFRGIFQELPFSFPNLKFYHGFRTFIDLEQTLYDGKCIYFLSIFNCITWKIQMETSTCVVSLYPDETASNDVVSQLKWDVFTLMKSTCLPCKTS